MQREPVEVPRGREEGDEEDLARGDEHAEVLGGVSVRDYMEAGVGKGTEAWEGKRKVRAS
jgi:hypothetical protein